MLKQNKNKSRKYLFFCYCSCLVACVFCDVFPCFFALVWRAVLACTLSIASRIKKSRNEDQKNVLFFLSLIFLLFFCIFIFSCWCFFFFLWMHVYFSCIFKETRSNKKRKTKKTNKTKMFEALCPTRAPVTAPSRAKFGKIRAATGSNGFQGAFKGVGPAKLSPFGRQSRKGPPSRTTKMTSKRHAKRGKQRQKNNKTATTKQANKYQKHWKNNNNH